MACGCTFPLTFMTKSEGDTIKLKVSRDEYYCRSLQLKLISVCNLGTVYCSEIKFTFFIASKKLAVYILKIPFGKTAYYSPLCN